MKELSNLLLQANGIRLINVLNNKIESENIEEDIYVFPKDIDLFNLVVFG